MKKQCTRTPNKFEIGDVVHSVSLGEGMIKRATRIYADKDGARVIKATLRGYSRNHKEIILTWGAPNYAERLHIKKNKIVGVDYFDCLVKMVNPKRKKK